MAFAQAAYTPPTTAPIAMDEIVFASMDTSHYGFRIEQGDRCTHSWASEAGNT